MKEKKILYVSSEVVPYLPENEISSMSFEIPKMINKQGGQIRIFMPRYGNINERRHQLHEVIRLSGINLVIDDLDMPLIIKVASIPKERIQVYFIDNEEYFPTKQIFHDLEGDFMSNNDERMMFYCKGVIETVRKLGWAPDIIHCQGWFSSLVPMYIKKLYHEDPLFENVKIFYSVFENSFEGMLSNSLAEKLLYEKLEEQDVSGVIKSTINDLHRFAIDYSDAVVQASAHINEDILSYINSSGKMFMPYPGSDDYVDAYQEFYDGFLEEEPETVALIEKANE